MPLENIKGIPDPEEPETNEEMEYLNHLDNAPMRDEPIVTEIDATPNELQEINNEEPQQKSMT
jgi:hypothetical protein